MTKRLFSTTTSLFVRSVAAFLLTTGAASAATPYDLGAFQSGNPVGGREYPVVIDTTKLENGWHSFAARSVALRGGLAACSYCDKGTNFETGVAKFYFFVRTDQEGAAGALRRR